LPGVQSPPRAALPTHFHRLILLTTATIRLRPRPQPNTSNRPSLSHPFHEMTLDAVICSSKRAKQV